MDLDEPWAHGGVFPTMTTKSSDDWSGDVPCRFHPEGGLTLRQYYAGLAMQAMVQTATANKFKNSHIDLPDPKTVAPWAIGYADALIKALAEGKDG